MPILFSACSFSVKDRIEIDAINISAQDYLEQSAKFKAKSDEIYSYRAIARSKLSDGDSTLTQRHVFLFEYPDNIRVEVLPINSAFSLALFVANQHRTALLDVENKEAQVGTPKTLGIESLLRLPIDYQEFEKLLVGRIPDEILNSSFELECSKSKCLLNSDQRYLLVSREGLLEKVQYRDKFKDIIVFEIEYSNYVTIEDLYIPAKVLLKVPRYKFSADLELDVKSLNQDISEGLFQVKIPSNYSVKDH